jgi:hypothetical protein
MRIISNLGWRVLCERDYAMRRWPGAVHAGGMTPGTEQRRTDAEGYSKVGVTSAGETETPSANAPIFLKN